MFQEKKEKRLSDQSGKEINSKGNSNFFSYKITFYFH